MNLKFLRFELMAAILVTTTICYAGDIFINANPSYKRLVFGNGEIMITLDYNGKCVVSDLKINGQNVISGPEGIFSSITTPTNTYSTLKINSVPRIKTGKNTVTISNIEYGDKEAIITENWDFTITGSDIRFEIKRSIPGPLAVEEAAFPSFTFNNINTWDGAFTGYGGLAWFYLFNEKLCTYGVHSDCSIFWNSGAAGWPG